MPTITGTESGETLNGTAGDDIINALGGNDTIELSTGHDTIDGGNGFDVITGGVLTPLSGLPTGPRSYVITANNISEGSGALDTTFTGIEYLSVADYSGYDVTLVASGYLGTLGFWVGAGNHSLTGGGGNDSLGLTPGAAAVVDGGAGTDTLYFKVEGAPATFTRSGDTYVLAQDGITQSAEAHNIESINLALFGGVVDASQVDVPLAISLIGSPNTVIGGSAGDVFTTTFGVVESVLTGLGGADRYVFSPYSPDLGTMNGTVILDLEADDRIDLSTFAATRTFVGSGPLVGAGDYRSFAFRGATFVQADFGASLLTIANGRFVLAETAPGSEILRIASVMSDPDPAPNAITGTEAVDLLEGGAGNDHIHGLGDDDLIDGGADDDTIDGGTGQDTIFGGAGDDTIDGGEGFDTVRGEDGNDTLTGFGFESDWMMGGRGDDTLIANNGIWFLYGGDDPAEGWNGGWNLTFGGEDLSAEDDGNDHLTLVNGGSSWLDGGSGNDVITVSGGGENVILGGSGNDIINASGSDGPELIDGGDGNDQLRGGTGEDELFGGADSDTLNGGTGADTLTGGLGNDIYIVDAAGDEVVEGASGGTDKIHASTSYTLAAGVHVEQLFTVLSTQTTAINLTGNELANTLLGNAGANTLSGGGGNDVLSGLGGNDIYIVDAAGDVVMEGAGGGTDKVHASVSYTLAAGVQVEQLLTILSSATTAIDLTGNELANTLVGNAGANALNGYLGDDTLIGGAGADTLDGGDGIDTLSYVGSAAGVFVRLQGFGARAGTQYAFGGDAAGDVLVGLTFENATGGNGNDNLIGSSGDNVLAGGAGNDVLNGYHGNDTLNGGTGADTLTGGDGIDTLSYAGAAAGVFVRLFNNTAFGGDAAGDTITGFERVLGSSQADDLRGSNGANVLDGALGNDLLRGFGGLDTFRFTTALGAGNVDTVADYSVAQDTIEIDDAVFTGLAAGALAAGAFRTGAASADADDRIIYNSATGALLFDADGNGAGAAVQFATLSAGLAMAAGEFAVI